MLKNFCFMLLIAIVIYGAYTFLKGPDPADMARPVQEVTYAEMENLARLRTYVDARPTADYDLGHAPQAVNMNKANFSSKFLELMTARIPDSPIIVYSTVQTPEDARYIVRMLQQKGLKNVYFMTGGVKAFKRLEATNFGEDK